MNTYEIEHIGITVDHPVEMAEWYKEVLGFKIRSSSEDDEKGGAFVTDPPGRVMIEMCKIPGVTPLKDRMDHNIQFHIALKSSDPDRDADYLVSKGARFIEKCQATRPGEHILVLSDPWGNTIQLAKRPVNL